MRAVLAVCSFEQALSEEIIVAMCSLEHPRFAAPARICKDFATLHHKGHETCRII
jgi:hypothetical protein